MLGERLISYREQTVGSHTHISFNHLQSQPPLSCLSWLDVENRLLFFQFMHFMLRTRLLFPSPQLSLFNILLSLIHSLAHCSVCLSSPLEQISSLQLLGHATFVPRAVQLKVMQIECFRVVYKTINLWSSAEPHDYTHLFWWTQKSSQEPPATELGHPKQVPQWRSKVQSWFCFPLPSFSLTRWNPCWSLTPMKHEAWLSGV